MKVFVVGLKDYEIDVTREFDNKADADDYFMELSYSYDCEVFYSIEDR